MYNEIKKGLNASQIAEKYNLKKGNISYYTKGLEKEGCIKKVGYAT